MKTERELFLRYWTDNNLPYDGDDDDMEVAWTAWQASAQREGYKLVPVNPTEDMYLARFKAKQDRLNPTEIFTAMIGALE